MSKNLISHSTTNINRLTKHFTRLGIRIERTDYGWNVHNATGQANIMLPESFELEDKAVQQLLNFASVHPSCEACATPDFHPGTHAPVGAVVATARDVVIPRAIGTDINCGMRMIRTGLNMAQVSLHKDAIQHQMRQFLLENVRNVPLRTEDFIRLYNEGPQAFIAHWDARQGQFSDVQRHQREKEWDRHVSLMDWTSNAEHAPDLHTKSKHGWIRDPQLGTPGSGNHFVEVQVVDRIHDKKKAYELGLRLGDVVITLHSGSRDVGFHVGGKWMDRAKDAWPMGVPHPSHGLYALQGDMAATYLEAMGTASRYAWLNRFTMDECLRTAWHAAVGVPQWELIVDVPHNVIGVEGDQNVHRKGATPAHLDQLGVIPGSMGDASYLVSGLGNDAWLRSSSHGAGRAVRRQEMRVSGRTGDAADWTCIALNESRKWEEHPSAYKPIGPVIEQQVENRLIDMVVQVRPWFTFKA